LTKTSHYWIRFNENLITGQCQDAVLAYRLWEISERILIQSTGSFDSLLTEGDIFSSYTAISAPEGETLETNEIINERDVLEIV
jgi:hypothetical protein